jgi:cytochrome c2
VPLPCTVVLFTPAPLGGKVASHSIQSVFTLARVSERDARMSVRLSVIAAAVVVVVCLTAGLAAAADAASNFSRRCSSCHTFGRGVLVGPDLKGATDRHSREWLAAWISSPESLVRAGDAAATALFDRFKPIRMPDQGFTAAELSALLDYLAAGGPEASARRKERRADTATAAEIEMGRSLFVGERALANGGISCFSCHRIGNKADAGGTLGPDLSSAYTRYQDKGLAALLMRGCFPRARPTLGLATLTEQETFALKAFLRPGVARPDVQARR